MRHSRFFLCFLAALLFLGGILGSCVSAAVILKPNDRIVIYGDSITEQRMYSRYLQQYLDCRYPDLHLHFYNAGWGGDTAGGALHRLQRDVLSLHPTVVTLFFGMNDGGYRAVDDAVLQSYRNNMEGIIKALQAQQVTVIVFTPGCVDPDRRANLGTVQYNTTLEALGKVALELAKQYNCPSADIHQPMLAFQTAQKALDPKYFMIPDSIHPNVDGHLVMTYNMLQAFGAEAMPPLGDYDVTAKTGNNIRLTNNDNGVIALETITPTLMPFWFEAKSSDAMLASGFLAMAGQKLTVRALPAAVYDVAVNDAHIARFTRQQLADGILIPGSYAKLGKEVHDLIHYKEDNYFTTWREISLGVPDAPGNATIVEKMMAVDEAINASIQQMVTPGATPVKIVLTPVPDDNAPK